MNLLSRLNGIRLSQWREGTSVRCMSCKRPEKFILELNREELFRDEDIDVSYVTKKIFERLKEETPDTFFIPERFSQAGHEVQRCPELPTQKLFLDYYRLCHAHTGYEQSFTPSEIEAKRKYEKEHTDENENQLSVGTSKK